MDTSIKQLADLVGGKIHGDSQQRITGADTLACCREGDISLLDNPEQAAPKLSKSSASALVVPCVIEGSHLPQIVVDDVHATFAKIVLHFRPRPELTFVGRSPGAIISESAVISESVQIYPLATIGEKVVIERNSIIHAGVHIMAGCHIGEDVTIFPGAVLYENTRIGARSIIHANAVIGAYGFGYKSSQQGHELSAQLGMVEIGEDVDIGACTTVDRGTYGATTVGRGTKIDNLVMVAHNVRLGQHNLICSQVGIAGSTSTGDNVVMAGQVGIRDHVHIGQGSILGAMSGVSNDVPEGSQYLGIPATTVRVQKVKQAALAKLPEMRKQLKKMQRTVESLVAQAGEDNQKAQKAA